MYSLIVILYAIQILPFTNSKDWNEVVVYHTQVVPWRVTVIEGTPVTVHCGSSTTPLEWFYGSGHRPIPTKHIKVDYSIILYGLRVSHTGPFSCKGTYKNKYSELKIFYNSVRVKVVKNVPYGWVLPSRIEVSTGDSVTLACGTSSLAQWLGMSLKVQNITYHENRIVLQNLQKEHSGPYICRGSDKNDKLFSIEALVIVDGNIRVRPSTIYRNW